MSEGTMPAKIAAALVKATRAAEAVEKAKRMQGEKFGYAFAGADALMAEAREALAGAGLAIVCYGWRVSLEERHDYDGEKRVAWTERVMHSAFLLVHDEGETHALGVYSMPSIPGPGRPVDKADASALTYATGYVMRGLLNLPRVEKGSMGSDSPPAEEVDMRDDSTVPVRGRRKAPTADERAESIAREVGVALADVANLEMWISTYGGKANEAIGMERLRPLVATAATRLNIPEAAWQSWIAKAVAATKR